MATIYGLPDGGAGITFDDTPSHHNEDGTISVSMSEKTLKAMRKLSKAAKKDKSLHKMERPQPTESE